MPDRYEIAMDWLGKLVALLVIAVPLLAVVGLLAFATGWLDGHQRPPACTVALYPDHSWRVVSVGQVLDASHCTVLVEAGVR